MSDLDRARDRLFAAAREWARRDGIVTRSDQVTAEQEGKLELAETELRKAVEALDRAERQRPS